MEDLSNYLTPIKELLLNTPLKDKSLMAANNPIVLKMDKAYPVTLTDVTFTFGFGAEMQVMLFNDEDDKDPDSLLAVNNTPLTFDTTSEAFLKYTNKVSAKANAAVALQNIGFNMDLSATGTAQTVYYKKHANTQPVNAAFISDIASFKTIFKASDVQALEEGNALVFNVNGTLSASLKVSWSNIFSQSLSAISKLFPVPLTLDVNIAPSLSGAFTASITDAFCYVVKKEAGGQCLVNFNRKKSTALTASAGISVDVGFANQDDLQKQLTAIYDKICTSVFGADATTISDAVTKWKQNISDASQNAIVAKLLAYFKLDNIPTQADALLDKLTTLQQKVKTVITTIAKASVQAGFTYQYQRLQENDTLLSASIGTTDLLKYHDQLLRFNPAGLLDGMRNNDIPFTLHSFLQQQVLTISHTYGFGFKLFNVINLTSNDYEDKKVTQITNLAGNPQIKVDRTRGYKWQIGKAQGAWLGDFSAAMANFSATPAPLINDFGFNLLLEMVTVDPNMLMDDLQAYLDAGAVWGSVRGQDVLTLAHKYANLGLVGKPVSVDVKLSFGNNALALILQHIASAGWGTSNIQYLAQAMAASMTWLSGYQWRSTPAARQLAYYPLWLDFLTHYDPSNDEYYYGEQAEATFNNAGAPDHLAEFEGDSSNWVFGNTFAGVIRSNPSIYEFIKDAVQSLIALQQMLNTHQTFNQKAFSNWLDGFMPVFSQSFYVRTLGNFLLQHAAALSLNNDINTVITLTVGTGSDAQVISISAS